MTVGLGNNKWDAKIGPVKYDYTSPSSTDQLHHQHWWYHTQMMLFWLISCSIAVCCLITFLYPRKGANMLLLGGTVKSNRITTLVFLHIHTSHLQSTVSSCKVYMCHQLHKNNWTDRMSQMKFHGNSRSLIMEFRSFQCNSCLDEDEAFGPAFIDMMVSSLGNKGWYTAMAEMF